MTEQSQRNSFRVRFMLMLLFCSSLFVGASAQTVIWTDSFKSTLPPTLDQCQNWNQFLDQLAGKSFVSVTLSGSRDPQGKTLSDPAAATELARLLSTRTPGTVISGGHSWTVTACRFSACGNAAFPYSIALSYDGNQSTCDCNDRYAIRPQATDEDWGGLNVDYSCTNSPDQTMQLVFSSGVTISTAGSTTLCEESAVTLKADVAICNGEVEYLWSNDATTETITVSEPGNYYLTVFGEGGCMGISETVVVTRSDVAVDAGTDANYCEEPIQLNALGTSMSASAPARNNVCLYSPPGRDCVFISTVCLERGVRINASSYSAQVDYQNPVRLIYNIYYSAYQATTFTFKLNGQEIGSHLETLATGICDTKSEGKFPQSFTYNEDAFKRYWVDGGANELTVEVETPDQGIRLAGITVDVETSNEYYSWSPSEGLSHAYLKNPLASPTKSTDYTVKYTDANGCDATDVVTVTVKCENEELPVAICKEVEIALEEGCDIVVDAEEFNGGSTSSVGDLTFTLSHNEPFPVGVTDVMLTVTDANGSSSCPTKITVVDAILPVVSAVDDITVPNDDGSCSAIVVLEAPNASDNCAVKSVTHDQEDNVFPVGETLVTWTAEDIYGNVQTVTQKVIVTNVDPVISSVNASASSVPIGSPVTLAISITDNNAKLATIDWGDSSTPTQISNPSSVVTASHLYASAGSFDVAISIVDHCDGSASYTYASIHAYDGGGSVRGDGWFESERGFYVKNPRASGKAQFHFDGKYKKGSSIPEGSISFKFKSGDLEFKSSKLDWLQVVDDRATLYGTGKLNNAKNYAIMISAVDADWDPGKAGKKGKKKKDEIRVKIWDPAGKVIYDTQAGDPDAAIANTDIGGGSIDIKQSKTHGLLEHLEDVLTTHFGEAPSVYPNPFEDRLNVQYNSHGPERVVIELLDLSGSVMASKSFPVSDHGNYSFDIPAHVRGGIYVLIIKQGKRVEHLRLVRK